MEAQFGGVISDNSEERQTRFVDLTAVPLYKGIKLDSYQAQNIQGAELYLNGTMVKQVSD